MKFAAKFLFLVSLIGVSLGCTYQTRHQQFSLAVRVSDVQEGRLVRTSINNFAEKNGFRKKTQASDASSLEKKGMYLLSYFSNDNSYISLNNIVDPQCYDVAIYSSKSAAAAKSVGTQIVQYLSDANFDSGRIQQSVGCNSPKK